MKTLEESVVTALDGSDKALYPFLPYILQDLWELGADPDIMIKLIRKHVNSPDNLKVLDLGCGKGAVSIKVSKAIGCHCHGIDAIPEFIAIAEQKAKEHVVGHLCTFETGDIRTKVNTLSGFDVIILGAIGPVFGDYYSTLTLLSGCLNSQGIILIDDGYIGDSSEFTHPLMVQKKVLLRQIHAAGMKLIEEEIIPSDDIRNSDQVIIESIQKRCMELIRTYPEKQQLFLDYIKNQESENDILENKVIGSTMVIKFREE